ncbi:hypothetical protein JEU11_21225 [Paraglaciecola chathamensis]|jgi:hypothetical protein|uniref:Uncharacterized protein n=1 Tax=Paraglaciecola chathamensis TaxID=368405 RepID=A0ABS0WKK6_9ALTE|nr:hypothetical protein [Paraglaciecola chathamensis]MBJ2138972.1 hypothetical protein [Paraglaciecola chathamensis]|tara:strand:+ start:2681 stop:3103 length:423 start_codon:yes stop_codon:yes gene_type:complete
MRYAIILLIIFIVIWVGQFSYTLWIRPIDQPTSEILRLEKHFNNKKIIGHIYPVRHGYNHSRVLSVSAFKIEDYPLPFGLVDCATEQEAISRSSPQAGLPNELQPVRNGKVVLDFTLWGDDTISMAQSVKNVFMDYVHEP